MAPPRIETPPKNCNHCGTIFHRKRISVAASAKAKYCSASCAEAAKAVPIVSCATCGKSFKRRWGTTRPHRFCSIRCSQANRPVNPTTTRYRSTKIDGKHTALHRVVAMRTLGRRLTGEEVVHHKDENKLNNDPSNLEVMSASEHGRLHSPTWRPMTTECAVCGTIFTPHKTKRGRKRTCSRDCMKTLLSREWTANHGHQ